MRPFLESISKQSLLWSDASQSAFLRLNTTAISSNDRFNNSSIHKEAFKVPSKHLSTEEMRTFIEVWNYRFPKFTVVFNESDDRHQLQHYNFNENPSNSDVRGGTYLPALKTDEVENPAELPFLRTIEDICILLDKLNIEKQPLIPLAKRVLIRSAQLHPDRKPRLSFFDTINFLEQCKALHVMGSMKSLKHKLNCSCDPEKHSFNAADCSEIDSVVDKLGGPDNWSALLCPNGNVDVEGLASAAARVQGRTSLSEWSKYSTTGITLENMDTVNNRHCAPTDYFFSECSDDCMLGLCRTTSKTEPSTKPTKKLLKKDVFSRLSSAGPCSSRTSLVPRKLSGQTRGSSATLQRSSMVIGDIYETAFGRSLSKNGKMNLKHQPASVEPFTDGLLISRPIRDTKSVNEGTLVFTTLSCRKQKINLKKYLEDSAAKTAVRCSSEIKVNK